MASAVNNYQNMQQDPELVPPFQQVKVFEDLVDTLRFVNFRKYENRLIYIIQGNPWVLCKINIFMRSEEKKLNTTKEELERKLMEEKEFRTLYERLEFDAELKIKQCCLQEIEIGLHFALLMKQIYELSFEYSDQSRKVVLETQRKLLSLMKQYEKRWKDRVPTLSYTDMQNIATGELEIHFCRQKSKTRYHEREHEAHRMHNYEQYTPTSTQMETDCSVQPVRTQQRLDPRMVALELMRNGLPPPSMVFNQQLNSIEKMEELLTTLDLNI